MNIMHEAAHQIAINDIAQKMLADKYKKELEKMCPEQGVVLDLGAKLENKISAMEVASTQL